MFFMIPLNVMATTAYQKAIAWAHESGTRALTEACWPVSAAFAMQVHEEYGPLRVMLLKGSFYAERNLILKRKRFGVDHVWVQAMDDYENRLLYDLTIEQFKDGDQGPLIGVPVDTRHRHGAFQPMDGENGKAIFRELHRLGYGPLLMRIAPRLGDPPYWSYSVCMPEPGKPAPVTPV
jgi:hypothetical protein